MSGYVLRDKGDDSGPVCLEWPAHDLCARPATHEVRIRGLESTFGAVCNRCVRCYNTDACDIRELTRTRAHLHELLQWRDGTIRLRPETQA